MGRSYSYEDGEWGLFVLEAYLENEGVRPSLGMAALTERQKDGAKKAARAFTKSALAALPKNGKESLIRRFGGEDGAGFIVYDILSGGGSENQIGVPDGAGRRDPRVQSCWDVARSRGGPRCVDREAEGNRNR